MDRYTGFNEKEGFTVYHKEQSRVLEGLSLSARNRNGRQYQNLKRRIVPDFDKLGD